MPTIIHTFNTPGNWTDNAPAATQSAVITMNGGGGSGDTGFKGGTGFGGGGGGYLSFNVASMSPGTALAGVVADQSNPSNGNTSTTCTTFSLTANSGTYASGVTAGLGGNATGGDTNTTGQNGGITNTWDGGSSPNGGAEQVTPGANGNPPGGGGAGGTSTFGNGTAGQVVITYTTGSVTSGLHLLGAMGSGT